MSKTSATFRKPVKLPSLFEGAIAEINRPPFKLERSEIINDQLMFENDGGFDRAIEQGFFLVKMPDGVDTTPGDIFVSNFYKKKDGSNLDAFRGYREIPISGDYQGYFDREHDQWENFYIERNNWNFIPAGVASLGAQMASLGITILLNVFKHVNVPISDWPLVTGGLSEKRGHQMFAFNHFRSEKKGRGCKFHRDSGWVTVLRSSEPGLCALIGDSVSPINPVEGYFIINFGSAMEVLTEKLPQQVRANIHGVAHTSMHTRTTDRTSYTIFLDSSLTGDIYQYQQGKPIVIQSYADFAAQEVSRTYDDSYLL